MPIGDILQDHGPRLALPRHHGEELRHICHNITCQRGEAAAGQPCRRRGARAEGDRGITGRERIFRWGCCFGGVWVQGSGTEAANDTVRQRWLDAWQNRRQVREGGCGVEKIGDFIMT